MNYVYVAQDANINNVVVNKPANSYKIRDCGFFYNYNFLGNFSSKNFQ